jgi:glycosyltransferase involved in cell wall biosynthesis
MNINLYMTVLNKSDSLGNVVKSLQDSFNKLGYKTSVYCYKNNRSDLTNVRTGLSFLWKILFSNKDEIHWFQYPHYYPMLEIMKYLKGIRVVEYQGVTPASLWKYEKGKELLNLSIAKRGVINYSDIIVTHSKFAYKELKKDLNRKIPNIIIPINTDTRKFKKKRVNFSKYYKKYGLTKDDIILITVGRFSHNKRIPLQISALRKVLSKNSSVKLLIIGNSLNEPYIQEYNYCRKLAERLKISNSVKFLGLVSEDELVDLYNLADVYVCSSVHEGFCMPVMEAMSCGTPVISADIAATPETIGSAGLIFKHDDSNDLAKKILFLIKNKTLYNKLVKKSLMRAKKNNITIAGFKRLIGKIVKLKHD